MTPDPEPACVYHDVGRDHGSMLSLDAIRQNLRTAMTRHFLGGTAMDSTNEEVELRRWELIVNDTLDDLDHNVRRPVFNTLWKRFEQADAWRLFDDVIPTLRGLKSQGYLIAVASNFDARLRSVIEGLGVQAHFDEIFISSDLGWSKPNPKFFDAAAHRIGVDDRSTLLMIGDTYQGDVQAAQQAGLDARHLIRDHESSLADLTRDL